MLQLELEVADAPAGPLVRYRTSRQNYWVALQAGEPLKLIRRDQDQHIVLAIARDLRIEKDRLYECRVECQGSRIAVAIDGVELLSVEDDAYPQGQIGLRTDGPARFANVRVLAEPLHVEALGAAQRKRRTRLADLRKKMPQPVPLHSVALDGSPAFVQVQDINGDGRLEILTVETQVTELNYMRIARLAAYDWDGQLLWQLGQQCEAGLAAHGDAAFNVADIDADGRTEILVTHDFEILVVDGASGEIKRRAPTPRSFLGHEDHYPRMVGDSFLVCNLRGLASPQDFVLKDRYCNLWAFTDDLKPLWHRTLNIGHYPRARDIDGDGRDEIMAGYSLLAADGTTLWTVPGADPLYNRLPAEHCDSVLIEHFGLEEDAPLQIAMAASDFGFLLMDVTGKVLAHHRIGHAQRLVAARFRPDLPDRQFAVSTFWGNGGIVYLFDNTGQLLLCREMPEYANSRILPVNWLGDGSALLALGNVLLDGNFEPVVELPGPLSVRPYAWDVNGDGLDELLCFSEGVLTVYGPANTEATVQPGPRREITNWNLYGGFFL